jgi:hypothetical protein
MLNHDRVAVGNVDDECRRSKKAVFTAPSIPMLIWQARTRASAMAEGRDAGSATVWRTRSAQQSGGFVNPFAVKRVRASPLWDGAVSARMWASTSTVGGYSLHTPAFGTASTEYSGCRRI